MSLVWGLVVIATAWWTRDTDYRDAWIYLFFVWAVLFAAFEAYYSYKNRSTNNIQNK